MKIIDLSGKKFHFLTVIKFSHRDKLKGKTYWLCLCDCGLERLVSASVLNSKNSIARCNDCNIRANRKLRWKGFGDIFGDFYNSIFRSAGKRGIDFLVSKEDLWNLFLKQDRKCALTDQEITLSAGRRHAIGTASLDRIDSSKGYLVDNIQWVHKDINIIKRDFSQEYFIKLCCAIANKGCD
jgi:hypothetical protein